MKKTILPLLGVAFLAAGTSQAAILLGYEFDMDTDLLGFTDQGNRFVETVAGGFYSATDGPSPSTDYQMRNILGNGDSGSDPTGASFTIGTGVGEANFITFRLRQDGGTASTPELFVYPTDTIAGADPAGNNPGNNPFVLAAPTIDQFQTYTVDLVAAFGSGTTISSLRLDPRNTQGGFTVDFIRIESIPEPSSALLGVLGLGALCIRRRRK